MDAPELPKTARDPLGTPPGTPPGPRKCKCWDDLVVKLGPVWGLFETPDPPKMQMLERFGGQIVSGLGSIRALVFIKIRQPQRRVTSSTNQSSSSSLKLAVFKFQSQVPVARRTFTRGLARIPSSIFPGHLQNYAPCSPIPCLLLHRFSWGPLSGIPFGRF